MARRGPARTVVLVDRLESFAGEYAERDGGRLVDAFDRLLQEGRAAGLTFVLAGDRTAFTPACGADRKSRLVLRQADRGDYALLGLDPRAVPHRMPDGRAVWTQTGTELQIAMVGPGAPTGTTWAPAPEGRRPRRVDPLPAWVNLTSLEPSSSGGARFIIGVGGDELAPIEVDLAEVGPGFLVTGPARSGRSTALACAIGSLPASRAVVVCPRRSPLRELTGWPPVATVVTGTGPAVGDAIEAGMAAIGAGAVLVIDDAELIADGPAARVLETLVRDARDSGVLVVAAATTEDVLLSRYRGWLADLRRSRSGLLLRPGSAADGEVFDLRLPRDIGRSWPAGRALLARRGETMTVQVAVPDLFSGGRHRSAAHR